MKFRYHFFDQINHYYIIPLYRAIIVKISNLVEPDVNPLSDVGYSLAIVETNALNKDVNGTKRFHFVSNIKCYYLYFYLHNAVRLNIFQPEK